MDRSRGTWHSDHVPRQAARRGALRREQELAVSRRGGHIPWPGVADVHCRFSEDACPDFAEFRKHMRNFDWETEVWLCDAPDHMIHYDGERFLGPRE